MGGRKAFIARLLAYAGFGVALNESANDVMGEDMKQELKALRARAAAAPNGEEKARIWGAYSVLWNNAMWYALEQYYRTVGQAPHFWTCHGFDHAALMHVDDEDVFASWPPFESIAERVTTRKDHTPSSLERDLSVARSNYEQLTETIRGRRAVGRVTNLIPVDSVKRSLDAARYLADRICERRTDAGIYRARLDALDERDPVIASINRSLLKGILPPGVRR